MYIEKKYDGSNVLTYVADTDVIDGKLIIPGNVGVIADELCSHRQDIYELEFQDGIVSIGTNSFSHMPNLRKITRFPNTLKYIGWGTFCGNQELSGVLDLPSSLINMGSWAFSGSKISKVKMHNWVNIGCSPFRNCDKLSDVEVGDKKYTFKTFKPYSSCKDEEKIIEFLIDSEAPNPIFNKRGLTVYKGLVWRNILMDHVKKIEPKTILNSYVSQYKVNGSEYTGIGTDTKTSIMDLRHNVRIPKFYNFYDRISSEKLTMLISFKTAVNLYMGATGISTEDIRQFLLSNGYMDNNWNPEQQNFMAKEIACIARGNYGSNTFTRYMLGFMHDKSYNTYEQGGKSYSFYGIEKNLHKCDTCPCLQNKCNFSKILQLQNVR